MAGLRSICGRLRSSNKGIIISDDDCWRVSTSDGMRIQISFRQINTSIADPVQHTNRQGRLDEVKTCLVDIRHTGEERHKNFVRECLDNPTRFEEPIKRVELLTFKQEGNINRRSTNRNIIAELKCSRVLMGRFLIIAPKRHIDLSTRCLCVVNVTCLELVYAKQPIIGLTQELCWVRACVGG